LRYVEKFKDIAIREMERAGVPASIKLAQGILESDAGRSELATRGNNHFGIKCGSNWKGDEYYKKDDDYDQNGRLIKSCFRKYRNADASFVAHSEFLRDPKKSFRYGFLFRLDPTDYRGWAEGLRRAGYATNPRYPQLLIGIIERYNLQQYDAPGAVDPVEVEAPVDELITGILHTNDVSYFVSEAPMSVEEVARQVDMSVRRLLEYNEGLQNERQQVTASERVYLQKKRRAYRGRERYHTVEAGENLYDVAQRYGLRLDILARRNRLREQDDPATGTKIKLRGGKISVDDIPRLEGIEDPNAPPPGLPDDDMIDVIDPTEEDPYTPPTTVPTTPRPNPTPTPPATTTPTYPRPNPNPPATTTPQPPVVRPPTNTVPPTNPNVPVPQYHSVVKGETLYAISRRYGLTVAQLQQLNGLTGTTISVGQRLRVK
ncbi:MAG: glucosaminidase domain-containing protein, partial [Bacteroidota bacterium]